MNSRTLIGSAVGIALGGLVSLGAPTASAAPAVQSCTVTPVSTVGCSYKDFYGEKKHGHRHHPGDDDHGPEGPGGPMGPPGHHHHHHGPPPAYGPADKWTSCYAYCQ